MNYELAKKLKDAGFPLKEDTCFSPECTCNTSFDGRYVTPTLEELIEACGDSFDFIKRGGTDALSNLLLKEGISTQWVAGPKDLRKIQFGSTPEEAVANLWLALNNT